MFGTILAAVWLAPAPLLAHRSLSAEIGRATRVFITVFDGGFGSVKEDRGIRLDRGPGAIVLNDVAARMESASAQAEKSTTYLKLAAQTVEFPVTVPKDGATKVTYTVRPTW